MTAAHRVSVIVPWRPDGGHRDRAWAWCAQRWAERHPDWQLLVGEGSPPSAPWCKADAIADALPHATGEILVIADADVWCDAVAPAVDAVAAGLRGWAVPHHEVRRLTRGATAEVLAGTEPHEGLGVTVAPYPGWEGGGIVVLPRRLYTSAPLDPRYRGWGQEDESAAEVWRVLAGPPWRYTTAPLWHLWHEPQPRAGTGRWGSAESRELRGRYAVACLQGPRAVWELLAEIPRTPTGR